MSRKQRVIPMAAALFCFFHLHPFAQAATFYVSTNGQDVATGTSWGSAKLTIQAAVDAAANSDTVVVSNGVYASGGRVVGSYSLVNRVAIDKAITVRSVNGPAVTIIEGDRTLGPAAVRCVYLAANAKLDGFTLTNGGTRASGSGANNVYGGGVYAQSSLSVITNCILSANSAAGGGGGTYGGTLNNCTLTGNSSETEGGGAYFWSNPGSLNNCTLTGNSAKYYGGGAYEGTLNNCLLTGNAAPWFGGGAAAYSVLNNCTVRGNSSYRGGGTYGATLNNSIVYYNSASYGSYHNDYYSSFSFSCTTPLPGGAGNNSNAPDFIAADDLRLAFGSPCINAGSNGSAAGNTDLDGNARIQQGTVDMGAYEYEAFAPVVALLPEDVSTNTATLYGTVNAGGAPTGYFFEYGVTTNYGSTTSIGSLAAVKTALSVSSEITGLLPGTQYHFRLSATNSEAHVYGDDATFTTWAAIPEALTQPAGITTNGIVLNGSVNAGGAETDYYFEYGVTTNYDNNTGMDTLAAGTQTLAVSNNVEGLLPNTTYHFRVVASNSVGAAAGTNRSFTTPSAPPSVVTAAADVSTGAALLNGALNPGGAETAYYFEYGITTNYGSLSATGSVSAGTSMLSVSNGVSGLAAITLYHFRLVATNENGTTRGENLTFTTPAAAPLAATDPAVVSTNAATLNGTINPGGAVTQYSFEYGTTTNYGSNTDSGSLSAVNTAVSVNRGIDGLTPATLYHYRVVATNGLGVSTGGDRFFTTPAVVPAVVTQSAAVSTNAATLNGTINPGGAETVYFFEYGLTTNYGTATATGNLAAGTFIHSVSNGISGLAPVTLYHFRLVATNSAGSTHGADLTFITPQAPPGLVTLPAEHVEDDAATLSGMVNPGTITAGYYFEYGVTTNYGQTTVTASVAPRVDGLAVSSPISGLLPGTLYHFRIAATNSVGISRGDDLSFTTLPATITQPATLLSTNSATLNATVTAGDMATAYYFEYGLTTNFGSSTASGNLPASPGNVSVSNEVSGLSLGTLYYFRSVASNSGGATFGEAQIFSTLAAIPVVASLPATEVTFSNAILNGSVNPGAAETAYFFEYGLSTNYGITTATNTLSAGTVPLAVSNGVSGLLPGRIYHFRLAASNSAGADSGQDLTFTTTPGAETRPATLVARNEALLNGTVTPGDTATGYYFEYGTTTNYGSVTAPVGLATDPGAVAVSNTVSGLLSGTEYHFRLVATNSAGITAGSDFYFQTKVTVTVAAINGTATGSGDYFPGSNAALSAIGTSAHWELAGWNDGDTNLVRSIVVPSSNSTYTATFNPSDGAVTAYVAMASATPVWPYASWATAATTIQDAVDILLDGDTVVVSNGVYATGGRVKPPYTLTNRVMVAKALTLRSLNGPAVTTIVGNPVLGDAAVRCVYLDANASLSGFTLTGGATHTNGVFYQDEEGGGVFCESGATVSNCTISGNAASDPGGGARYGTLVNCTLSDNVSSTFGGGAYGSQLNNCILSGNTASNSAGGAAWGVLTDCTLIGNHAGSSGGGSYGSTLIRCVVKGNTSGAYGGGTIYGTATDSVFLENTSRTGGGSYHDTLTRCLLSGNTAEQGGGSFDSTLHSCEVSGNTASYYGGGISGGELNNCTIVGNTATYAGGGTSDGTLHQCIAYYNTAPSSPNAWNSTVNRSCTTPDPGGTDNITNTPQFVSIVFSNYHLKATSPCIDMGTNTVAAGSLTDRDGNPRIQLSSVDLGAYEFQPMTNYLGWSLQIPSGETDPEQSGTGDGYPNLLKYATGSSVTESDALAALGFDYANSPPGIRFNRNTNATDVTLFVEATDELSSNTVWTGIATNQYGIWSGPVVEIAGDASRAIVTVEDPQTNSASRMFRLKVSIP